MRTITVIGIDLAKNIFQIHANDARGKTVLTKRVKRSEVIKWIAKQQPCVIGMEACSGASFWGIEFAKYGHTVRLIAPQFVKPYVKSNKNDMADAEAIAEAVTRPNMRFVPLKQVWQRDIQSVHRVRERLVRNRTALINEVYGLLSEYGVVIARKSQSEKKFCRDIGLLLCPENQVLTDDAKQVFQLLLEEFVALQKRVDILDKKIITISEKTPVSQRLQSIPGVGPITATAMIAAVGDATAFKNGRQLSAWLGLVPRQCSSGGRQLLLGISKRGDSYLRSLLVHGARSTLRAALNKKDRLSLWALEKEKTRGRNRATVAIANKNARIIWALMTTQKEFEPRYV